MIDAIERRIVPLNRGEIATRADGDDTPVGIEGHTAVFNQWTDLGWFEEMVAPGAFTGTIADDDIRALFNHDPNFVLGRNVADTLTLREDDVGLWFRTEPPGTQWANDLIVTIERGDIDQASFGFRTIRDSWEYADDINGKDRRTLLEVQLYDVGPVTFGAYPQTDVKARAEGLEVAKRSWTAAKTAAGVAPADQLAILRRRLALHRL